MSSRLYFQVHNDCWLSNRTQFEQNFLREFTYFICANHHWKIFCLFIGNHFELSSALRLTRKTHIWYKLLYPSNSRECLLLGPRVLMFDSFSSCMTLLTFDLEWLSRALTQCKNIINNIPFYILWQEYVILRTFITGLVISFLKVTGQTDIELLLPGNGF